MRKWLLLFVLLLVPFVFAESIDLSDRSIISDGGYTLFSVGPEGVFTDLRVDRDSSGSVSVNPPFSTDLVVIGSGERTEVWDLRKSGVCEVTRCPYLDSIYLNQVLLFYDPSSRELFVQFPGREAPAENTYVAIAGQLTDDIRTYEFFRRPAAWGVELDDVAGSCDRVLSGVVYNADSSIRPRGFSAPLTCIDIRGSCGDNVCNKIESFRYCDADCMDKTNNNLSVVGDELQGVMTGNGVCSFEFRQTGANSVVYSSQVEFGELERKDISIDVSELPRSGEYGVQISCESVDVPLKSGDLYMGVADVHYCRPGQCASDGRCLLPGMSTRDNSRLCTSNGLVDVVGEGSACVQGQCAGQLRCTDGTCSFSVWQRILRFFGL